MRIACTVVILGLALIGLSFLNAQGSDTPITVGDGSLTLTSAVPWANFKNPDAKTKAHPDTGKSVPIVTVTLANQPRSISFRGQRCEVTVRYGSTDLVLTTDNAGKALKVVTDWTSFRQGANANTMVHANTTAKISRVVVKQGNATVLDARPNGGTKIEVNYR